MKCVIDGQTELEYGQVCDSCRRREAHNLAEIVRLHALLGAAPDMLPDLKRDEVLADDDTQRWSTPPLPQHRPKDERDEPVASAPLFHRDPVAEMTPAGLVGGETGGPRVSGSREAPLPLRVDALDLTMPARALTLTKAYDGQAKDQIGHLSVASVLDGWVRDWRDVRAKDEHLPVPTVSSLALWLRTRLDWACDSHPAVDEYHGEISELLSALMFANEETRPKPERCDGVPCRDCDMMNTLYRAADGTGDVECAHCGCVLDADSYKDWTRLNAAATKEMAA